MNKLLVLWPEKKLPLATSILNIRPKLEHIKEAVAKITYNFRGRRIVGAGIIIDDKVLVPRCLAAERTSVNVSYTNKVETPAHVLYNSRVHGLSVLIPDYVPSVPKVEPTYNWNSRPVIVVDHAAKDWNVGEIWLNNRGSADGLELQPLQIFATGKIGGAIFTSNGNLLGMVFRQEKDSVVKHFAVSSVDVFGLVHRVTHSLSIA